MRLITSFLIVLLFAPFLSIAQDFDFELSSPYEVIDAEEKEYFYNDGEILSVKVREKKNIITIQKWDAESMKEISRKEYTDAPDKFQFESLQEFDGNYYMFYSVWDKANKKEQCFVRRIDFQSGTFSDKGTLLFKIDGKVTEAFAGGLTAGGFFGMKFQVRNKFNIEKSFDGSKVLIQYRKKPTERNDDLNYDIIGFNVYNSEMEEISREEIKMPYTEAKMNNLDYAIDSKGHMYVLSLVYLNDKQRLKNKDGSIGYKIELLRIDEGSAELTKTPVEVGQYYLNEVQLYNQSDDQMLCAGFYTTGRNLDNADGVIMFKVDEAGEISDMQTYEIPVEVLNMYMKERQQKKNEKKDSKGKAEFAELKMRHVITNADGSMILIGEQHYVVRHETTNSQGQSRTYYTYHYNDMLITKINADGDMAWMKKLGKRQTGKGNSPVARQGGMSFKYFRNADSHYLMFLDNVKNKDLGLDQRPKGHSDGQGGFFTAYKLDDETGDISKVNLFDVRDVKGMEVYQFQINRIVQTSETEFVVEVYKKKKEDVMIKVRVKV